jgi:hypothetical protein
VERERETLVTLVLEPLLELAVKMNFKFLTLLEPGEKPECKQQ